MMRPFLLVYAPAANSYIWPRRFVYVIDDLRGHVKIGIARNPQRRLASIQACHARALIVAYQVEFEIQAARRIEQEAHRLLKVARRNGEWFEISVETAKRGIHDAAENLGHKPLAPLAGKPWTWPELSIIWQKPAWRKRQPNAWSKDIAELFALKFRADDIAFILGLKRDLVELMLVPLRNGIRP